MNSGRTIHHFHPGAAAASGAPGYGRRALAIALLVIMVLPPSVRAGQVAARSANAVVVDLNSETVELMVGRSTVIRMDRPILRVSLSTPDIADAMVTTPYELLVHGKAPGTISVLVWSNDGRIKTYDVMVRRDLSNLQAQMARLFPTEDITVVGNGKDVVLSGVVSTKYIVDRASSLAVGYVDKPENVVNLIRQQEAPVTNQVMLKVRFAEVSRSAMQELGASFFTGPNGKGDWIGRSTTQQYPAPEFDQDKGLVFSDFLNLFAFNTEEQLGTAIKALKGRGLFESLAEPNLVTQDGKEASFLAGGEYPYPVVQGTGATNAITIVFKEFGVRLRFTPTITADDMIQLKVMPEVSSLDFANGVVLEGFRVPALSTRRTETNVELRDGQTFAIAGLIDRNLNETLRRVPGIGDIPILGYLFRSQAYQKNATELVVMITPHILRRNSPGVTPNLPAMPQPLLPDVNRPRPWPAPAFSGPQSQIMQTQPAKPAPQAASTTPFTSSAPVAQEAPVNAPVTYMSDAERKATEKAKKDLEKRIAIEQRAAAVRANEAAKLDAIRQAKEAEELARTEKADAKRQAIERKLEEKRAAEQAVIDRKRWLEQQEAAARTKELADTLAREQAKRDAEQQKIDNERLAEERKVAEKHRKAQEKLAKEQAERDAELERLVSQYRKLTEDTSAR